MGLTLKDLLLEEGLVTGDELENADRHARSRGQRLRKSVIELGYAHEEEIISMLSRRLSIRAVDPRTFDLARVARFIPAELAWRYGILPLSQAGALLTVAPLDPTNLFLIDDLRFATGWEVEVVVASEDVIIELLEKYFPDPSRPREPDAVPEETEDADDAGAEEDIELVELEKENEEAPVVRLCNLILTFACWRRADQILLESYSKEFRVRFRIDGVLHVAMSPPMKLRDEINNRFKRMARIDFGDRGHAQRGDVSVRFNSRGRMREQDMEVTIVPTAYGDMLVIDILPMERRLAFEAERVFSGLDRGPIERIVAGGQGIILVTGPPRSGSTTTLLSLLSLLDLERTSVATVSAEIRFSRLRVSQVSWHDALSVREAFRSALSQSPDVLLFDPGGPIHVLESILEGAPQGLLFMTLQARDAISALRSLLEHGQREKLGIDSEIILRSVRAVTHQRLLRRLCAGCQVEGEAPIDELRRIGVPATAPLRVKLPGQGCHLCNRTAHRGMVGVFETLVVNERVRRAFASGATDREIREQERRTGWGALADQVFPRLVNGEISPDEVLGQPWP